MFRFEWPPQLLYRLRRHHRRVAIVVDGRIHELNPHRRTHLMLPVTAGHAVALAIAYLDANGHKMLTQPTPDGPPSWTDAPSAPGIDTLTVAPDGSSAILATNPADADGSDTVGLSVTVGGKTFSATLAVAISAAPQVLSSVEIVGTVQ
jgi:hypothetical protein